jgi:hypothetical protein
MNGQPVKIIQFHLEEMSDRQPYCICVGETGNEILVHMPTGNILKTRDQPALGFLQRLPTRETDPGRFVMEDFP